MDPALKKIRVRFSGEGEEKTEPSGPQQKTQSFKERRKSQNVFHRQFSGQMSQDYDSSDADERATAVAAAAFAIKSMEDSPISDRKTIGNDTKTSPVRIKGKKVDTTTSRPEPGRFSKIFSGAGRSKSFSEPEDADDKVAIITATTGKIPTKAILPTQSIKKTPTFNEQLNSTDSIKPETAASLRRPSIKKTPTFNDKQLNSLGNINPEVAPAELGLSTTMKPGGPLNEITRQSSPGPGRKKTRADIWEEAEIARLKERYENQKETILSWEDKKKKKAKHRLDTKERDTEQKRAKALRKFNSEMENIIKIAEGARAQADKRYNKEVLKVNEKANVIRRTGKAPTTCLCF